METKIDVRLTFKINTPPEFDTPKQLMLKLKKYHGEVQGPVNVEVCELEHQGEKEVYFMLHSNKHANALWQQNLLLKYLKANYAGKVLFFETAVWVNQADYDYCLEEEEF